MEQEATTTPAAVPKKKEHGIHISIGDDAPEEATRESKFTPEQRYELELARAKNGSHVAEDLSDTLVPIVVPGLFFLTIFGIVAIVIWSRSRRNRMMHETIRAFAEKGLPVPPEIFREAPSRPRPKSDLRRGIIWVAIGLGTGAFLFVDHDRSWGLGFIPLCIGLGYLLAWKLEAPEKSGPGA